MANLTIFWGALKKSVADTNDFLNELPLKYWLPFFASCVFLGWNGIQIVFSLNLILSFINTRSMATLIVNSIQHNARSIPIYGFAIVSFFVIFWLMNCIFEAGFVNYVNKVKEQRSLDSSTSELIPVAMNFFTPTLIMVLLIFVFWGSGLLLLVFGKVAGSGFDTIAIEGYEALIFRFLVVAIISIIVVLTLLKDNVLPYMCRGYGFKHAILRSYTAMRKKWAYFLSFYLLKIVLIIFSVQAFTFVLRHLFLPYFVMLEARYSFSVLMFSSSIVDISEVINNIVVFYLVFTSSLIIFAPIMAPFYVFQLFLLKRLRGSTGA